MRERKRKAKEAPAKRRVAINKRNMVAVSYQKTCGCCCGIAHFKTLGRANEAWKAIGLVNAGRMVDDAGETHDEIDSFYPPRVIKERKEG